MTQPSSPPLLDPAHLATLCHELRQPLHAYRIFSDQLIPLLKDQPLALATQMNAAIQSLTVMTETLHEIARTLDPKAHQQLRPIELQLILADLQDRFANPRLSVRQTKLVTESDSIRLTTILKHLVRNALQHGNGRCLIGCRKNAREIRLDIIDQGPGLPEESPPLKLQQGKTRVAKNSPGLGLGLHIVRQLAARLGHRLEIVSRPGHGTRASLFLPDITAASPNLSSSNRNRQAWLSGKTIQLAGMSPNALKELETLLTTWGANIIRDTSPPGTPAPDLIISNTHHSAIRTKGKHSTLLILAAPPSLSPTPGIRYLPPPTTPPRLRMAITNILGSKLSGSAE